MEQPAEGIALAAPRRGAFWRYSFTGAVRGVVIQQVEVLPEELTVHLGSYGAGAGATAALEASGQKLDAVEQRHDGP